MGGVLFDKAQQQLLVVPPGLNGGYIVPTGVLRISDEAFTTCQGLTNVLVANTVTEIGDNAFLSCTNLTTIFFQGDAPTLGALVFTLAPATAYYLPGTAGWSSSLGGIPAVALTYPGYNFTVVGGTITILQYTGSETQVAVPATIAGLPVTAIALGAFQSNNNIKSVVVPGSVTSIEDKAFKFCSNLNAIYFLGNAPTVANASFSNPTIVYYLPGTSGWSANLGTVPARLWNPQPSLVGVTNSQFGFTITGPPNLVLVVEACTNLANAAWSPVATNTLTSGSSYFAEPQWTNYSRRYYRLRSP